MRDAAKFAKNNLKGEDLEDLLHPLYPPGLSSSNYYLLRSIQSSLFEQSFSYSMEIQNLLNDYIISKDQDDFWIFSKYILFFISLTIKRVLFVIIKGYNHIHTPNILKFSKCFIFLFYAKCFIKPFFFFPFSFRFNLNLTSCN